jgi:hypothetical protein
VTQPGSAAAGVPSHGTCRQRIPARWRDRHRPALPPPDRLLPGPADLDGAAEVDLANTDDPRRWGILDAADADPRGLSGLSDGRGFTIARRLRRWATRGRLLALGPVIADQYAMLRRVGFDGAEIPDGSPPASPGAVATGRLARA